MHRNRRRAEAHQRVQRELALDLGIDLVVDVIDAKRNEIWDRVGGVLGEKTVCITDWYHVMEHVWSCGKALHGEGTDAATQWVKAGETLLWEGHYLQLIEGLEEERRRTRSIPKHRALAELVTYLSNQGGRLAYGGNRVEKNPDGQPGYYMMPALFTDTTPGMRINREEIFGPVVSVLRAKNYDEALAWANDTDMGLSSGICTTSLKYASHFKRHAQAGMVMVNLPTAGVDYHVPFGGRKGSSYGPREQGRYAAEFYTTVKTAYTLP